MDPLKFSCFYKAQGEDFQILYSNPTKWNDFNYYTNYQLYAIGPIAGGKQIHLGAIRVSSIKQDKRKEDFLEIIMGREPFSRIDDSFFVIPTEETAQKLFILLSPEQRKSFIESLNMNYLYDSDLLINALSYESVYWGIFRGSIREVILKQCESVAKYLLSEIDYKSLPKL